LEEWSNFLQAKKGEGAGSWGVVVTVLPERKSSQNIQQEETNVLKENTHNFVLLDNKKGGTGRETKEDDSAHRCPKRKFLRDEGGDGKPFPRGKV